MLKNYKPKDIIAILLLIGFMAMKARGLNNGLDTSVALIIGYYFGHRQTNVDSGK